MFALHATWLQRGLRINHVLSYKFESIEQVTDNPETMLPTITLPLLNLKLIFTLFRWQGSNQMVLHCLELFWHVLMEVWWMKASCSSTQ
jgi:hypothetical protein